MKDPENIMFYLRSRHGLTQKQVALSTGLTINDISRLENGFNNPFMGTYTILSKYFKVPIDAFVHKNLSIAINSFAEPPKIFHKMLDRIKQKRNRNDEIGLKGEAWVYQLELEKLKGTDYANGVNPNFGDNDEAHFDILSFDTKKQSLIIDIKTTAGDSSEAFFMTANELIFAKECINKGKEYQIHRVSHVNDQSRRKRLIISATELFRDFDIVLDTYKIIRKDPSI